MKHFIVVAMLCGMAVAQDATTLQQTLAKIVFASQVNTITHLAHTSVPANRETSEELQQALSNSTLVFSVGTIGSGSAASIRDNKLTDYATWPSDNRTLQIGYKVIHITNENGTVGDPRRADPHWASGGAGPSVGSVTVGGAFSPSEFPSCSRYINPIITVSFEGHTVEWKALYFLDCADGKVHAIDPVMGDAVPSFWPSDVDVYPYELTDTGITGRVQPVLDWLTSNSSASCAGTKLCYENGKWVVPKEKLPALYVPAQPRGALGAGPLGGTGGLTCADYGGRYSQPNPFFDLRSNDDHWGSGSHEEYLGTWATCQYWGTGPNGDLGPCNSEATEQGQPGTVEHYGADSVWYHNANVGSSNGDDIKPPHQTSSTKAVAATQFDFCLVGGVLCQGSISISGVTVNFGAGAHEKNDTVGSISCPPQTGGAGGSPLVVDTENAGWLFVPPSVWFDMNVTGKPQFTAWPDGTRGIAFLALPDADGKITSGEQLFGNHTKQPACPSDYPHCDNGFRALAVYDDNGDGVIDEHDKIWPHLRLWIDRNMNGKVDGGELVTLKKAGISSISLNYSASFIHVNYGTLRWESTLVGLPDNRIFDVFLSQQ